MVVIPPTFKSDDGKTNCSYLYEYISLITKLAATTRRNMVASLVLKFQIIILLMKAPN